MAVIDLSTLGLGQESRARLGQLLEDGWSLPDQHKLSTLQLQPLSFFRLIVLLGPQNKVGSYYFRLFLVNEAGTMTDKSLAWGLFGTGQYPSYNWIELSYYSSRLEIAGLSTIDLSHHGLDLKFFQLLYDLIPIGGHLMVEYESPTQTITKQMLIAGYPPVVTPLGYLMFQCGCRSYKDWYISEGGNEGPRKLQGYKPLNKEVSIEKSANLRSELEAFLSRVTHDSKTESLRKLTTSILSRLEH